MRNEIHTNNSPAHDEQGYYAKVKGLACLRLQILERIHRLFNVIDGLCHT